MAGKVAIVSIRSQNVSFNFAVVFDFKLLPVPPSKAQFIDNDLMNGQNVAIWSMAFFLFYNGHSHLSYIPLSHYLHSLSCVLPIHGDMHRLLILFYWAETEIHSRKNDDKTKGKNNIDRHGPRSIAKLCHLSDPPRFSLLTTFKG
jgi:hypothetical protein